MFAPDQDSSQEISYFGFFLSNLRVSLVGFLLCGLSPSPETRNQQVAEPWGIRSMEHALSRACTLLVNPTRPCTLNVSKGSNEPIGVAVFSLSLSSPQPEIHIALHRKDYHVSTEEHTWECHMLFLHLSIPHPACTVLSTPTLFLHLLVVFTGHTHL